MDASSDLLSGSCGVGWIIKDGLEALLHQNSANRCFVGSALAAEALTLKTALLDAVSSGIRACLSDSKNLISRLTGNGNSVKLQGIFCDIRVLSNSFEYICFSFISRLINVSADYGFKMSLIPGPQHSPHGDVISV
ncbi:unnamed protein product [Thlaspi arvense]|uniref:RNase H type-1 domain-containing protein n=1 Tax=Thlaspi arvense TaxID=13288 RepID=A0AAU9SPI0_THLAR|nr:unnamed protein product [Thlaspi arvense]